MKLILKNKKKEVENTYSFIFESEQSVEWKAGQFFKYHITDPDPDARREDRFFTIASAPFENHIMLTTRFMPDDGSTFKKDLQNLNIGDSVEVSGPGGEFVVEDPIKQYIFIAGGIGITPFRSILLELAHNKKPINVKLLYANKTPDFVYRQELESLKQKNPNFEIYYFVDPKRIDEQAIRYLISDIRSPIYYVSGPEPMVEAIEKMLYQMGIPKEHVQRDYFPGYDWPLK